MECPSSARSAAALQPGPFRSPSPFTNLTGDNPLPSAPADVFAETGAARTAADVTATLARGGAADAGLSRVPTRRPEAGGGHGAFGIQHRVGAHVCRAIRGAKPRGRILLVAQGRIGFEPGRGAPSVGASVRLDAGVRPRATRGRRTARTGRGGAPAPVCADSTSGHENRPVRRFQVDPRARPAVQDPRGQRDQPPNPHGPDATPAAVSRLGAEPNGGAIVEATGGRSRPCSTPTSRLR
jgi:hypothetical protein